MDNFDFIKHREPVNISFRGIIPVGQTGVPQRARGFDVPAGASVFVRGHNGKDAGNTAPVRVGSGPDECLDGRTRSVAPNTQIPYPCSNTREINYIGAAGDGIEITVVG